MKRSLCLLLAVVLSGSLSACSKTIKINGKQLNDFDTLFVTEMPQEVKDDTICQDMYIQREYAFWGDPNYVIYFTLAFEDNSAFQSHIEKLNTALAKELLIDETSYYIFQGSTDALNEYTDSKIYDGSNFIYEIISIRKDAQEVTYLYAYVWDYWKNDFLVSHLEEIFKQDNNII